MNLSGKKVRGWKFTHWLRDLPPAVPAEQLVLLVERLKKGEPVHKEIIMGHMGLAMQIVSRYVRMHERSTPDEWVSEAFLAVCMAVERAKNNLYDCNITPFIVAAIHSQLARFIAEDRLVAVPYSSFRAAKGGKQPPVREDREPSYTVFNVIMARDLFDSVCVNNTERKILDMRLRAYTDAEIARSLGLSRSKVRTVRSELEEKLRQAIA